MRLMDEKRYEGLVFGEISAMTQFNRSEKLQTILEREDLHERIVNGSDYPLPAVNILIRTRPLVKQGYLNNSEGKCLKEIYDYNPLLFDFVLKRSLKHPQTGKRLPAAVFMSNPALSV
jgi:mannonate dehydratase